MPTTFKSLPLFPGPHRFTVRRQGQLLVSELSLGNIAGGTRYLGPLELEVTITGRLVADTEAGLWALRDAIAAQLVDPPAPGTLIDPHGRTWTDMSFVRFEPGPIERGRKWSLAFVASFIDFKTYPQ